MADYKVPSKYSKIGNQRYAKAESYVSMFIENDTYYGIMKMQMVYKL